MLKAYKYRIYPTEKQKVLLEKHFGVCRFVYNLALETKIEAYKKGLSLSRFDLQSQMVELKEDLPWMYEVNSQALCSSLLNLDLAYKGFFKGGGFPRFKSKHGKQSFLCPQGTKLNNGRLALMKFKEGIKINLSRVFEGKIKTTTISKTPTGKYFASILVDNSIDLPEKPKANKATGLDLGLNHFLITSEGEKIDNPRHLRAAMERLKVLQRRVSKKKKGSQNRKKAINRLAIQHERVNNKRLDFLHKLSTKLVRDNQTDTICMENLAVKNMIKNHNLAQAISDVSWGKFLELVKYKCDWYGKNLMLIDRFYPSSKTCSDCGVINQDLKLSDRTWTCECGSVHDRDINAAINIRNSGQGLSGEPVESLVIAKAKKQEDEKLHSTEGERRVYEIRTFQEVVIINPKQETKRV
jgi:putative transposase